MRIPDVPLNRREDDELDRASLVSALADMLITGRGAGRRASRLTVGLTGSWGSGKSSVLGMLADHLRTLANVAVVEFNPWVFQGRDDLLDAFFEEVSAQLGRDRSDDTRSILRALDKYRDAIEPAVSHAFPGSSLLAKLIPRTQEPSALAKRRQLEKRLEKFNGAIVVLIDELDRVDPEDIRALARLTKAVVDLPNISYLVSYDRRRVEAALGNGELSDGAAYLEKIVQINVPLRPLVTDEVQEMLLAGLRGAGYSETLGDQELMADLLERLMRLLETPRDVKRLLSSFAAMELMVRGEINPVDVLGYAAVCTKAPAVRDTIADDIDEVVNDPGDYLKMIRRRRESDPSVEKVFGEGISDELGRLLVFLFPRLNKHSNRDTQRFGRIQDRRNLLTMLFLGDPPFQISRKQLEAFWDDPNPIILKSLRERGLLGDFGGLLYRLLPVLNPADDVAAWRAITQEIGRGDRRMRAQGRNLARDFQSILVEFGARGTPEKARAQSIVAALIADDDLSLIPDLVRSHMFAHGMVSGVPAREGPTIYDREETAELVKREAARYKKHIRSGKWLTTLDDPDMIFALEQSGGWDDKIRQTVEKQLTRPGGLAEFAALVIPPGWRLESGTLERFVSEDLLRKLVESAKPPADEWLQTSLQRLRSYLSNRDPDLE